MKYVMVGCDGRLFKSAPLAVENEFETPKEGADAFQKIIHDENLGSINMELIDGSYLVIPQEKVKQSLFIFIDDGKEPVTETETETPTEEGDEA